MLPFELDYVNLLERCIKTGQVLHSRNGATLNLSGPQLRADLRHGFPLLSGKKIFPKHFLHELKWMLNGDTNIKYLNDNGSKIWDKWADEDGNLGPTYGKQFRNFNGIDQVVALFYELANNPFSRRHIISLWNPMELEEMALPPCFYSFQAIVKRGTVDLIVSQRSADLFIGLPYDICFYSVLLNLIVNSINNQRDEKYSPGEVVVNIGSAHIYEGHLGASTEYITRFPLKQVGIPRIILNENYDLLNYDPNGITFIDYNPLPFIPAEVYE